MNILDLPDCMIEQIFEWLSYDEISKKRLVCKRIDRICQHLLNSGFNKMIKRHNKELKRIKSLLPRRESERRNHPLARHADILTCIETRISMLSMTYTKYMDLNLCCFIPGKVIDEVFRILSLIKTTSKPLRAHEVLQELRDISSMAIEHFDEKIAHLLKQCYLDLNSTKYSVALNTSPLDDNLLIACTSRSSMNLINQQSSSDSANSSSKSNSSSTNSKSEIIINCSEAKGNRLLIQKLQKKCNITMKRFSHMVQLQNKHSRQLKENAVIMSELNAQIIELKKRVEEVDAKNRELSANIAQISGEPIADGGAGSIGTDHNSLINSTNSPSERTQCIIKPRAAAIILKHCNGDSSPLPSSTILSSSSSTSTASLLFSSPSREIESDSMAVKILKRHIEESPPPLLTAPLSRVDNEICNGVDFIPKRKKFDFIDKL